MDQGHLSEFASPAELLRDHKSKFYAVSEFCGRGIFDDRSAVQGHWPNRVQESQDYGG